MKKLILLLMLVSLLSVSCATAAPAAGTEPTMAIPSLTGTSLPSATGTPAPTATHLPVEGTLSTQVNVRLGPGTSYDSLGQLNAGGKVQVVSRNTDGQWVQILYPSAPQGRGWVAAQFVQVAEGVTIPLDATPAPDGPTGRLTQRINVRSGPGTTFDPLGMLEPDTVVSLTGKNSTASWFQIVYSSGPDGYGWLTSQYVQTEAAAELPVLDDYGRVVTPGGGETPSGPVLTLTPTVGPAFADGDSAALPAVSVQFSAGGTRQFIYSGQVSAPKGDGEDWIEFTPYALAADPARLIFSLTCSGNGELTVELWHGGAPLANWGTLACGEMQKAIPLPAGQAYGMRLTPAPDDGLRLIVYTLIVRNEP